MLAQRKLSILKDTQASKMAVWNILGLRCPRAFNSTNSCDQKIMEMLNPFAAAEIPSIWAGLVCNAGNQSVKIVPVGVLLATVMRP